MFESPDVTATQANQDSNSVGSHGHLILIYAWVVAIVVPVLPGAVEKVGFWETACMNRGVQVRIFVSRQDALDWLVGDVVKP